MVASLLAWRSGITRRISVWHFAARPCCTSLRLVTTSSSNMKSSLQTANFDIQSWRPYVQMHTKTKKPDASPTKPSQTQFDNLLSSVVVEAVPCTFNNIPNDSVQAIHGLLAGFLQTSDRLAAVPLDTLKPSPFYNMLANGEPAAKALTLLHFTQRGIGKQLRKGSASSQNASKTPLLALLQNSQMRTNMLLWPCAQWRK